jgi:hypothetical protein
MAIVTLQQIIDERISFLKEQINAEKKPQVNWTFQIQIDAIMSVDDTEKIEAIITQKKALSKNSKDVYESEKIFSELDDLEWLQRQIEILLKKIAFTSSKKSLNTPVTLEHYS